MEENEAFLLNSLDNIENNDLEQFLDQNTEDSINISEDKKDSNMSLEIAPDELFNEIDLNKIPEEFSLEDELQVAKSDIVDKQEELKLGLTANDIEELFNYISGKGTKPSFIDKFTSDSEGRLRDELYIMNLLQLSKLPMLVSFQAQIQDLMFRPENLAKMDIKELSNASKNISAEIQGIMKSATDAIQTMNTLGALNNEYRTLLNAMTMLPEEKIARIKEIVFRE